MQQRVYCGGLGLKKYPSWSQIQNTARVSYTPNILQNGIGRFFRSSTDARLAAGHGQSEEELMGYSNSRPLRQDLPSRGRDSPEIPFKTTLYLYNSICNNLLSRHTCTWFPKHVRSWPFRLLGHDFRYFSGPGRNFT